MRSRGDLKQFTGEVACLRTAVRARLWDVCDARMLTCHLFMTTTRESQCVKGCLCMSFGSPLTEEPDIPRDAHALLFLADGGIAGMP